MIVNVGETFLVKKKVGIYIGVRGKKNKIKSKF